MLTCNNFVIAATSEKIILVFIGLQFTRTQYRQAHAQLTTVLTVADKARLNSVRDG